MGALLPARLLLCAGEPRIDTGSGAGPHTLQAVTCEPIIRPYLSNVFLMCGSLAAHTVPL